MKTVVTDSFGGSGINKFGGDTVIKSILRI